jgi:hypothetical protein
VVAESTAIAVVRRSDDDLVALAEKLAKSTLLPKPMQGKMPDVLVTIMAGQEMGLAPMASLRAFHVIEGKPVMSSDGMVALVLGSGKAVYFDCVEESDTSVTYETLRVGSKVPQRCTWTWEMAKKAALHQKDNWRCYPRQMLASRAKAELARRVYPDVLMGCYNDDEASGWREAPVQVARPANEERYEDAEFVEAPAPTLADFPEIAEMDAAMTIAKLKELGAAFGKRGVKGAVQEAAMERYKTNLKRIQSLPTSGASSSGAAPTPVNSADSSSANTGEATAAP